VTPKTGARGSWVKRGGCDWGWGGCGGVGLEVVVGPLRRYGGLRWAALRSR